MVVTADSTRREIELACEINNNELLLVDAQIAVIHGAEERKGCRC
jgi:hypothetical protein